MDLLQRQCDSDELGLRNAELPIRASSSVFASLSIKVLGCIAQSLYRRDNESMVARRIRGTRR